MTVLATSLNSVGISQAKGYDLVALREQNNALLPGAAPAKDQSAAAKDQPAAKPAVKSASKELTPEQQRQVAELVQIDRAVHAHEQAHLAAGHGVVTGGASYTYTYGPDGKRYAVSGEVGIDTTPEKKPEANIDKGERIQAAALAPRDPSPQDYRVASVGSQLEARGRSDFSRQQAEERASAAERDAASRKAAVQQAYAPTASVPGATVSDFA